MVLIAPAAGGQEHEARSRDIRGLSALVPRGAGGAGGAGSQRDREAVSRLPVPRCGDAFLDLVPRRRGPPSEGAKP